ncbi:MAG TPA: twin-arginine translocase subunit TatC [Longimicrobiales bacterium]
MRRIRGGTGAPGPAAEMPFLDHLEELRTRILWSLAALLVGVGIGFWLVMRFDVLGLLIDPVRPYLTDGKLHVLGPMDAFMITLKLAIIVGALLASPVVVQQMWAFVSPALLPHEKRAIVPTLALGLVLFAGGVAMAYFAALPVSLRFLMGFQEESLQPMLTVGPYFGYVIRLLLAFGFVFELPVVMLLLSVLGIVDSQMLVAKRRHAIVLMVIVASLITPGDIILLTLFLMVPLILLYELSITLCRMVERRRAAAEDVESEQWAPGTM